MASLVAWMPSAQEVLADLAYRPDAESDAGFVTLQTWKGMPLRWLNPGSSEGGSHFFSGTYWSRATANHWEIPLMAVAAYLVMIPLLKAYVARRGKFDVRTLAFYWNAALSLFSWCGVFACVPVLVHSLWEHGLFFTTCAPASWYASGLSGFFVALFIYSKVAELVDTVLLLLAGKPVIALQWWHHSTVLLYCWHSYSVRIATGAWFAGMNYSVHAVMYGYFAVMGTQYRKAVSRYAMDLQYAGQKVRGDRRIAMAAVERELAVIVLVKPTHHLGHLLVCRLSTIEETPCEGLQLSAVDGPIAILVQRVKQLDKPRD